MSTHLGVKLWQVVAGTSGDGRLSDAAFGVAGPSNKL